MEKKVEDAEKAGLKADLKAKELDLWRSWKAGDDKSLPQLFASLRPIENSWFNKLPTNNIPESAVRAEIRKNMYDSLQKFNPSKGATLSTYLNSQLPKVIRYVSERQNIGRIPEHRALQITSFNTAKSILADRLGRDPNAAELADEMSWSLKEVERMTKDLRKDILLTPELDEAFSFFDTSPKQHILNMVYYELEAREKKVFEMITGYGGAKKLNTQEIAAKLNVSAPTVGVIKQKIADKIEKYMR